MYQFSPSPTALHLLTTHPPLRRRRRRAAARTTSTDALLRLADDS